MDIIKQYKNAIILAALLVALILSAGRAMAGQPGDMAPSVTVEPVATIEKSEPRTYIGTVRPSETVEVVARVSGYLWRANFGEGSVVKAGDVLFEIEDTDYAAKVKVAEALLLQAEAELKLAIKEHDRSSELLSSRAIAAQSYDTTEATELLKEARVAEARANLTLAQEELRRCRIIAPLSGRIGEKLVSEGNYVTPSSGVLATIVASAPVKVQFSMSESDYFRHFTNHDQWRGAEVSIERANGDRYNGDIKTNFVDNTVDTRTDTIMVSLSCANTSGELLPGGYVRVFLAEDYGKSVPAVSATAVMTDGSGHYVYVADADGTVEKRNIEVGDVVNRHQVVHSGLEPGELVVVGGMNKIRPGARVSAVPVNDVDRHATGGKVGNKLTNS